MFGALVATARDELTLVTIDGTAITFDPQTGEAVAQSGPPVDGAPLRVTAAAVAPGGGLLVADARNRRVAHLSPEGRLLRLLGKRANPSIPDEDVAGVLDDPSAILPLERSILVASGGRNVRHGIQRYSLEGAYVESIPHHAAPKRGWLRAHGIALVGERLWIAETDAEAIEVHLPDGRHSGTVRLPDPIRRPFRLQYDGLGGVLLLAAPAEEDPGTDLGVARLDENGLAEGWAVEPGEESGKVFCPFDLAVLSDGRFAVADLPLGQPPDVRVQLFGADGRLERVLFEDIADLQAALRRHFQALLLRPGESAAALYDKARIHHRHGGPQPAEAAKALELYLAALAKEPGHLLARMGLGQLMQKRLGNPKGAEAEYLRAIDAGGRRADLLCLVAECRHEGGDLDGAIEILKRAVDDPEGPEDYYGRVEELGSWYLERAGEPLDEVG